MKCSGNNAKNLFVFKLDSLRAPTAILKPTGFIFKVTHATPIQVAALHGKTCMRILNQPRGVVETFR